MNKAPRLFRTPPHRHHAKSPMPRRPDRHKSLIREDMMPVQTFEPMTKDFATFDCDAHVTEPPLIWERASEFLTRAEMDALRSTIWWDSDTQQLIVDGKAGIGLGAPRRGGIPGAMRVISNAGPGVKHDIQRALNIRNLNPKTALTQEQVSYLDFAGSYEPEPRLKDMDIQGIDQVMIIPTDIDVYPWLPNAVGAKAFCRAYNEWAYNYTRANPDRLFFGALLPMQNPAFAVEEVYRVAKLGCRVALIRPMDAMGNYPLQPKYDPVWQALEDTGMVYGMHPFPAFGEIKPSGYTEQHSGAELVRRTMASSGVPHSFLGNVQHFQAEASLWVVSALMSGFFERFPKIKAAVFEASSTWISFLLDECDKMARLYKNERQLPPLKRLPSETFFEHCMTGFEGDEAPPPRFPEFYGDILIWSSDVYHHDGDDAWRAMQTMQKYNLPAADQAKFLGGNARRLYNVQAPSSFIRDRVTQIERPDWWPTEAEIQTSLAADAAVTRR
ncbi:MAG: amidohydrolase [Acetobacteraceae bacterium]|nr:amidohydrolase [Acetobacteraceae bacterium]MSP30345.1 amidohydrolase [Acetobacteraceae bacterium]